MATRKTKPPWSKLYDDDKAQFNLQHISWVGQFIALVAFDGHETDPDKIWTVAHSEVGKAAATTKLFEATVMSAGEDLLDEETPMEYVVIAVRSTDPVEVRESDIKFVGKFSAKFKKDFAERVVKHPLLVLWASDDSPALHVTDAEEETADAPVVAKKPSRRRRAAADPEPTDAEPPKPKGPAKAAAKRAAPKTKPTATKAPTPRKAPAKANS